MSLARKKALPSDLRDRWEDWFQPGETLLWEGAPAPGFRDVAKNTFFTACGIPFLAAGLVVMLFGLQHLLGLSPNWSVWHIGIGVITIAFSIPFTLVGGAMVFGGWVQSYLRPKRVRYALSSRAGYVASRYWNKTMETFPIHENAEIDMLEHADGTATIRFFARTYRDSDGDRQLEKKGFEFIQDGQEVYQLVRQVQAKLKEEGA